MGQPLIYLQMELFSVFLLALSLTISTAVPMPIELKSQLPANPIEDPPSWAWGRHPRNGFGYKAKDSLAVEVCLANPALVDTAKCKLPLDVCLDNPSLLPLLGCSGNQYPVETCTSMPSRLSLTSCDFTFPLSTCTANPQLFTLPQCSANLTPQLCASTPSITRLAACTAALVGYEATLFDCQDNKEILCSLNMCEKHEFLVEC